MSEEEIMLNQEEMFKDDYVSSYLDVPYFLLEDDVSEDEKSQYVEEMTYIRHMYTIYQYGVKFLTEGSNSDYVPSTLRYKKSAMIMNKEVRFLFSNPPTFNINIDDVGDEKKDENSKLQDFLDKVLDKNNFHSKLLKGAKDCFIGKRVAIVLNVNEENGITINFLNSLEFIYETSDRNEEEISKFVMFYNVKRSDNVENQRWFKKVYTKEKDGVYYKEELYSGNGEPIEVIEKRKKILFPFIPVTVVLNDGLSGDLDGESELDLLVQYEKYYSKLANTDMDALRKSMNPIRYTIDASQKSTENLSTSPGSYWDLQTDDDKPNENVTARVGTLEAQMNYSSPLKVTLDRIENEMYNEVDVPNITSEQLAGVITSGKTIQALYWGLTVRCDEKMLAWGPSLKFLAMCILKAAVLYPKCVKQYTEDKIPDVDVDIIVENNYPIPEDVKEEKEMDMAEVDSMIMSRKAYLKKWRKLNDSEADAELEQIKMEQEMLEHASMPYTSEDVIPTDEEEDEEQDKDGEQDVKESNQNDEVNEDA